MKKFLLIAFLLCLTVTTAALAQEECPVVVMQALETTHEVCADVGRNQACYGNIQLEAVPREGVEAFTFEAPGDVVDVASVQSLQLSSMNEDAWGVALLKLQANLPDTMPGQNVTFLLFGDVTLRSEGAAEPVNLNLSSSGNINVRSAASRDAGLAGALSGGQTVIADGRNEDGTWIHIQSPDGWVFAELVSVEGDVMSLSVTDGAAPAENGALQAFYFTTGVGETTCAEAPNGILIQSPVAGQRVSLNINGTTLNIGSTVFVSAPQDSLNIAALAGVIQVEAAGETRTFVQGSQVSVALDEEGIAAAPPSQPEPLAINDLSPLVTIVNDTALMIPTYEDAAQNPVIQQLGLAPLSAEEPLIALTEDEIAAIDEQLALLAPAATPGLYRREWGETLIEGDCSGVGFGDGGGDYAPDDPINFAPLCEVPEGGKMLLDHTLYTWDGELYASERYDDGMGGSFGHVATVIDPSTVEVLFTSSENDGACNISTPTTYTLVQPGVMPLCAGQLQQEGFNVPDAPAPEKGEYTVEWRPFGDNCAVEEIQPTFNTLTITSASTGAMRVELDGESFNLSGWDGSSYDFYGDIESGTLSFALERRFANDFHLRWNFNTPDYDYCSANATVTLAE